jgi:DHA1 family tetracycline resistance protein-like MFS transporter
MTSRPLLAISFIVFVDVLAFTIVLPYLPFYAEHFGAKPAQVGLLITVFAICQFLASPVLGKMSDQIGRKPILFVSQIGTCIGFIVLAFANSLPLVYLARIIDGITAGNITVAQAAMSDVTKPQERAKAFSMIGVAFGLGFFLGPAFAGLLSPFGFQAPAYGAAFFSLASIVCTYFLFEDAPHIKARAVPFSLKWSDFGQAFNFKPVINYFKSPKMRQLMVQLFLFNLSFAGQISGFALFAERRLAFQGHPFGAKEVGFFYAYLGFLGIGIRSVLIDRLVKNWGERKTGYFGFFCQGLGYCGYAFVHTIPAAMVCATLAALGSGLIRPVIAAQMSTQVSEREQGVLFGVGQSLASLASIISPIIAGVLLQAASPGAWAMFCGVSMLLAIFA